MKLPCSSNVLLTLLVSSLLVNAMMVFLILFVRKQPRLSESFVVPQFKKTTGGHCVHDDPILKKEIAASLTSSKRKENMWNILNYISTQDMVEHYLKNNDHRDLATYGTPHIVTATSHSYFDRLENFIGSIHRMYEAKAQLQHLNAEINTNHPPNDPLITHVASSLGAGTYWTAWNGIVPEEHRHVLVYDLGLTTEQRETVRSWKHVELAPFPIELLPDHFQDLKMFAWKPVVMYLALQRYPSIIFLDSGVELWNRLDRMEEMLFTRGHLFVVQPGLNTEWRCCGTIGELTVEESFRYLGLSREEYGNREMCSGGIQGYLRDSQAYRQVLIPAVECAWERECIAPRGSGLHNHRQDQSIFSLLIHKSGLSCEKDVRYWANRGNYFDVPKEEIVIFLRKGEEGKQFKGLAQHRKSFAVVVPFSKENVDTLVANVDSWKMDYFTPCDHHSSSNHTDLIFYALTHEGKEIEGKILQALPSNTTHSCFRIAFEYGDDLKTSEHLSGDRKLVHQLLHHDAIQKKYEHFFLMKADTKPIRPNWLNAVQTIVHELNSVTPDFWTIGVPSDMQSSGIYSTSFAFRNFYNYYSTLKTQQDNATTLHFSNKFIPHQIIFHTTTAKQVDVPSLRSRFPRTFFLSPQPSH